MIDANAYVGNWPFRQLRYTTPAALLGKMDALGIERAVVSSLENVFYKDLLAGNRDLHALVRAHADRFLPAFTINPIFPGWEEDLEICVQEFGMRVMRLHPNYHQYALDAAEGTAVLEAARAHGFVVNVTIGMEDTRHHHPLIKVPDVPSGQVAAAVSAFSGRAVSRCRRFVLGAQRGMGAVYAHRKTSISIFHGCKGRWETLRSSAKRWGADHVLFGTNLPLHVPEAATMAIEHAKISADERRMIAQGNAVRLFGL